MFANLALFSFSYDFVIGVAQRYNNATLRWKFIWGLMGDIVSFGFMREEGGGEEETALISNN